MTPGIFLLSRHLRRTLPQLNIKKNRVIPKPTITTPGRRNTTPPLTLTHYWLAIFIRKNNRRNTPKTSASVFNTIQVPQQLGNILLITGIVTSEACRKNPRRPIKRINNQPRIISNGNQPGLRSGTPSLKKRILQKGSAGFFSRQKIELGLRNDLDIATVKKLPNLNKLARVASSNNNPTR